MNPFSRVIDGIVAFIVICVVLPSLIMKNDSNKKHKSINWASVLSYIIICAIVIGGLWHIKTTS